MEEEVLITLIGAAAGAILSLSMSYIPGLNTRWDQLQDSTKQAIFGGLLVITSIGIALASCSNLIEIVACDQSGLLRVAFALFGALTSSQGIYSLSPKTPAVKTARAKREVQ